MKTKIYKIKSANRHNINELVYGFIPVKSMTMPAGVVAKVVGKEQMSKELFRYNVESTMPIEAIEPLVSIGYFSNKALLVGFDHNPKVEMDYANGKVEKKCQPEFGRKLHTLIYKHIDLLKPKTYEVTCHQDRSWVVEVQADNESEAIAVVDNIISTQGLPIKDVDESGIETCYADLVED